MTLSPIANIALLSVTAALGGALIGWSIRARGRSRIARRQRARRLYRVVTGTATERDYRTTTLYEMKAIIYAPAFTLFCRRNGFRV